MYRPSFPEYGVGMALWASTRSEDLHTKVGAVAFDTTWNTMGTYYNGFLPKQQIAQEVWENRDFKNKHVVHAESWLVSKTKQNGVHHVCLSISPCSRCCVNLAAHGVKEIYFAEEYHREQEYKSILKFYGIAWYLVDTEYVKQVREFIKTLCHTQKKLVPCPTHN